MLNANGDAIAAGRRTDSNGAGNGMDGQGDGQGEGQGDGRTSRNGNVAPNGAHVSGMGEPSEDPEA